MQIPVATYRVQFNKDFRFDDAAVLAPYLRGLGISHLYASPILQARKGSTHGYDVTDPTRVNPELGDDESLARLSAALKDSGIFLLLDIVPNHMAASPENPWWTDLLENGQASAYAGYFDIMWEPAGAGTEEKLLLPILGSPYGTALENCEFKLGIDAGGLHASYFAWKLPLDPTTWTAVLEHAGLPEMSDVLDTLSRLPARTATEWESLETRRRETARVKQALWEYYRSEPAVRDAVDASLRKQEGIKGDSSSFDALDCLLSAQPYVVAYWRAAREKINYRRFFDVSELVSVRAELDEVHEASHALVYDLIARGIVHGVRIDHIDGLYDPLDYLLRLQARQPGLYVVVEKILTRFKDESGITVEELPEEWETCGTSGYDFLGMVNNLFIDPAGLETLDAAYRIASGCQESFEDVAYREKKRIMEDLFTGEVSALALHLGVLAEHDRHGRDLSPAELRIALVEVTACLPVYRTYTRSSEVTGRDRRLVRLAVEHARRRNAAVNPAVYDFLEAAAAAVVSALPAGGKAPELAAFRDALAADVGPDHRQGR